MVTKGPHRHVECTIQRLIRWGELHSYYTRLRLLSKAVSLSSYYTVFPRDDGTVVCSHSISVQVDVLPRLQCHLFIALQLIVNLASIRFLVRCRVGTDPVGSDVRNYQSALWQQPKTFLSVSLSSEHVLCQWPVGELCSGPYLR